MSYCFWFQHRHLCHNRVCCVIPCESDKFYIVLNFTFKLEPCPCIDRKGLVQVQKLVTLTLIFKVKLKRPKVWF